MRIEPDSATFDIDGKSPGRSQSVPEASPVPLASILASAGGEELSPLPRAFYDRETERVARDLLGKQLVHVLGGEIRAGRIVEVEAYLGPEDKACHSARGLTPRTRVMFGPPGHAYVYMIYGMYFCMNVVTEGEGRACAVLIRALEPLRNLPGKTRGPGLLCRSMAIDRSLNGHDLVGLRFFIADDPAFASGEVVARPRIGVGYAEEWTERPLRFYLSGNPYVSKP